MTFAESALVVRGTANRFRSPTNQKIWWVDMAGLIRLDGRFGLDTVTLAVGELQLTDYEVIPPMFHVEFDTVFERRDG